MELELSYTGITVLLLYINAYNMTVLVGYICTRTYIHGVSGLYTYVHTWVNALYVCCMCAEP